MNANLSPISRLLDQLGPKLILALLLLLALTLLAGVYIGRQSVYDALEVGPETAQSMLSELSDLREALRVTRGDLEVQRTRHEVDRKALELLRIEIAAEKERTAGLEEGLSFYRSMVVSEDPGSGLSLRQPELVPGTAPGRWQYRFFVQQKEREYEMVEGSLSAQILGVEGEREVSYPLSELSPDFGDAASTLHFRYFQAIEGELVLPDGFTPRSITLVARASKPHKSKVKKQFPWEVQERFINVGK
tara:strand:+ start:421 stop:1161 length:741 start_codon:yes stop_codon:yes gene_type:complete